MNIDFSDPNFRKELKRTLFSLYVQDCGSVWQGIHDKLTPYESELLWECVRAASFLANKKDIAESSSGQ